MDSSYHFSWSDINFYAWDTISCLYPYCDTPFSFMPRRLDDIDRFVLAITGALDSEI